VNVAIFGSSPLLAVLESNNVNLLNVLIDAGVDIAGFTHENKTALMVATTQCKLEIVRCLLQHQPPALLDAPDEDGYTALTLAISHGKLDIAATLLDSSADASIASNNGTTPLMECSDVGIAMRLLELGVDLHARDDDGMNALLLTCMYGNIEMVALLLDHGADTYSADDVGNTALMLAVEEGHLGVLEVLLQRAPADGDIEEEWSDWLNACNADGDAALHIAVRGGHVDCVQALIDEWAYPNIPSTADGTLPLQHTGDVAIARILLDAGEGWFEDDDDVPRLTISACKDPTHVEVLRLLLQSFPDAERGDRPFLIHAVEAGNLEAVRVLLEEKTTAYINKRDCLGMTALSFARDPDMMRLLLARGADPRILDDYGRTPLMQVKDVSCMRLLLDVAPELVGIRDNEGRMATAHLACSDEQFPMLVRLLQYCEDHGIDAEINNKDADGDTALHMAMAWGINMAVELLLEKGAEVMGIGCRGTTVLMKPFLEEEFVTSEYGGVDRQTNTHTSTVRDAYASDCLRMVLDAVLQRGRDADMVTDSSEVAEMENELTAKRRRVV
jgi:ankyrin repeat protein